MVQHAGSCAVEQAGAQALLQPGDMLLFHNSRPYSLLFEQSFRQTVIQVPRACVGGGVMRWLRDERLARCAAALADPALAARAIADIALAHGFCDVSAFGRSFKARYGCAPGSWRDARVAQR